MRNGNNPTHTGVLSKLDIVVSRASNLPIADPEGTSDPYVIVTVGKEVRRTACRKRTLNPTWGETLSFRNVPGMRQLISIHIFDRDYVGQDDLLCTGQVSIPPELIDEGPQRLEVELEDAISGTKIGPSVLVLELSGQMQSVERSNCLTGEENARALLAFNQAMSGPAGGIDSTIKLHQLLFEMGVNPTSLPESLQSICEIADGRALQFSQLVDILERLKENSLNQHEHPVEAEALDTWEVLGGSRNRLGTIPAENVRAVSRGGFGIEADVIINDPTLEALSFNDFCLLLDHQRAKSEEPSHLRTIAVMKKRSQSSRKKLVHGDSSAFEHLPSIKQMPFKAQGQDGGLSLDESEEDNLFKVFHPFASPTLTRMPEVPRYRTISRGKPKKLVGTQRHEHVPHWGQEAQNRRIERFMGKLLQEPTPTLKRSALHREHAKLISAMSR
eukprot:NODE_1196_length_1650_cov_25.443473_g1062_i0.p1 GENE.NODE_1196_length_1650_cov_25.443473_g1062_i0~~NODE_1196_length_1650_cov_25.443473_g1062_i0.p1  ORF type:complete len:444 (+),score=84.61 NODE_1196_length_1650_cov_25.443473_g1062_i0:156-1487(+)